MYKSVVLGCVNVDVPLLEGIALAGRHGFQGIEVPPDGAALIGEDKVRDALAQWGLNNAGFALPLAYKAADKAEFEAGAEQLKTMAETAARLGGKGCYTWITPWHETMTYQQHFDFMVERLRRYAAILKEFGIALGLEFVGVQKARDTHPNPFIYNIPQMLELCDAIGTGNCGLLLDCHHCYTAGHDMKDVYGLKKEQIVLVHVNDAVAGYTLPEQPDNPRALPRETGVLDIDTFMDALVKIGYEGPVAVEPFSPKLKAMEDNDAKLDLTMEALNSIWPA